MRREKEPPAGSIDWTSRTMIHERSSHIGRYRHAAQLLAEVRREGMPVQQLAGLKRAHGVRVEEHEVRIESRSDATLVPAESDESRRRIAHPVAQTLDRNTSRLHCCPDRSQPELERRNAAPDRKSTRLNSS